jgi:hypothetical protein
MLSWKTTDTRDSKPSATSGGWVLNEHRESHQKVVMIAGMSNFPMLGSDISGGLPIPILRQTEPSDETDSKEANTKQGPNNGMEESD